jgi:predicted DNA-binding protein
VYTVVVYSNRTMIRTQIYIPETTHKELARLAEAKRQSMAQVVRELIEEGVQKVKHTDYSGKATLMALVNLKLTGGPQDLSHNLDHYLYGGPKKEE